MDIFGIGETGSMVALALAGLLLVTGGTMVSSWSRRRRSRRTEVTGSGRRARRAARRSGVEVVAGAGAITSDEVPRIVALERAQADTNARLSQIAADRSAPEEQLKAMASQMLGLIRDKNATLETALAGLDQLRARVKTLEQIGDAAEARSLLEGLETRLAADRAADTEARADLEARLRSLESPGANPFGEIADQLTRLYAQKDAVMAGLADRLGPLAERLASLEAAAPAEAATLARLETEIAALRASAETMAGETGEALSGMHRATKVTEALRADLAAGAADRAALAETLTARLDAMAREMAARDPEAEIAGLAGRLDGMKERIDGLDPQAALDRFAERLAALQDSRSAATEALTERLGRLEGEIAARAPADLLARFGERLEALQARMATLEEPGESPFGEIADQLTRLYAQKDATVETVFARLAPLETKLDAVEARLEATDPAAETTAALAGAAQPISPIMLIFLISLSHYLHCFFFWFVFFFLVMNKNNESNVKSYQTLSIINTVALIGCAYFLFILIFVLKNICISCLLIDTIVFLNFILLFNYFRRTLNTPKLIFSQIFIRNWIFHLSFMILFISGIVLYKTYQNIISAKNEKLLKEFFTQESMKDIPCNNSIFFGNKKGEVKIRIFSDVLCSYCRVASEKYRQKFSEDSTVNVEFIFFPLHYKNANKQDTQSINIFLTKVMIAAGKDEKFWYFYDYIIKQSHDLDSAKVFEIAKNSLNNFEEFSKNYFTKNFDVLLKENITLVEEYKVSGTPAIFINGRKFQQWTNINLLNRIVSSNTNNKP